MEGWVADSKASRGVDKARVLDVKPLRILTPVFPTHGETSFLPTSVPQPYPPRYHSQFSVSQNPQVQKPTIGDRNDYDLLSPAPLLSVHSSCCQDNGVFVKTDDSNKRGNGASEGHKGRGRNSNGSNNLSSDTAAEGDKIYIGLTLSQRENGDREVVMSCLTMFDSLRRRLSQLEESKHASSIKSAHLKASNVLTAKNLRTNSRKRIGAVPGVKIGDIFYFRMELCIVGLHMPSMAGIDYMTVKNGGADEPVAVSIVSSGGYDDDAEETNVLIYTGQGGNSGSSDQKLERGNLALDVSSRKLNEIRVIRGLKDPATPTGKVYVYDGLYIIRSSWTERAKSGGTMFKHELVRVPDQPDGFAVWKSIDNWKSGLCARRCLIHADITSGCEIIPVTICNEFDEEKGPSPFKYCKTAIYPSSFKPSAPSHGCNCRDSCRAGNFKCSCLIKNGGNFPYTANGILARREPMIFECGEACPCSSSCKNRVSQGGAKLRLEVFKTERRGWGLRSWDPIRAGAFICEYAGEVIKHNPENFDAYMFDSSRKYHPFKWNRGAGLAEGDYCDDDDETYSMPYHVIISAKDAGNVARFMNHSCHPNTFWQPVTYERRNGMMVHVAFFSMRHIPPMTELTYDYGVSQYDFCRQACLCGMPTCRAFFG